MNATTLILFLLLLACPISMFFMHRGGGHGHGSHDDSQKQAVDQGSQPTSVAVGESHGDPAGHGTGAHDHHLKSGTAA